MRTVLNHIAPMEAYTWPTQATVTHCWKTIPYFTNAISIECKALYYWRGGGETTLTHTQLSVTIIHLDGFHATAR